MYSATISISSFRIMFDVYCAFFLPECIVAFGHHLQNCPDVSPVGRCPIIPVTSKWQVLFSTKYNCFFNTLQDVNVFVVHLLVGLAYQVGQETFWCLLVLNDRIA